jgi:hypothetical protein
MPNEDKDVFNEWASGISLANPTGNDFFEEIPLELDKPENFKVPTVPEVPEVPEVPTETSPETRIAKNGGSITLEKTSRGWRATLTSGEANSTAENFYGPNKDELIFTLAEGKLEASKAIHRLKKEKLLGGEEATLTAAPVRNTAKVENLSADDVYEIKNKLQDNPSEAIDAWVKKRFGLNPDEFAEALKSAPEAKRIVEAQNIKANIDEVNSEFVNQNPDYLEYVTTADNAVNEANMRILVARMAKSYLNKKITKHTPQAIVDDCIYEVYKRGKWTLENLETAKEELVESELFERPESPRSVATHKPEPVTVPGPSVPAPQRIATTTGQPVGLGIPARSSTPAVVPEEKPLTDVDLQNISLADLRMIAAAQLRAQQQGRQ